MGEHDAFRLQVASALSFRSACYSPRMEKVRIEAELPAALAAQARAFVAEGCAADLDDLLAEALRRFLESHASELTDAFMKEDAQWGTAWRRLRRYPGRSSAMPVRSFIWTNSGVSISWMIRVHGTVGILMRSIRRRQRSSEAVAAVLRELPRRSTLHVKPALLLEFIRTVEGLQNDVGA